MRRRDPVDLDSLLREAASDPSAFAAFYCAFERRLLAFFMRAAGRPELAADLAAETFACARLSCGSASAAATDPASEIGS